MLTFIIFSPFSFVINEQSLHSKEILHKPIGSTS